MGLFKNDDVTVLDPAYPAKLDTFLQTDSEYRSTLSGMISNPRSQRLYIRLNMSKQTS